MTLQTSSEPKVLVAKALANLVQPSREADWLTGWQNTRTNAILDMLLRLEAEVQERQLEQESVLEVD